MNYANLNLIKNLQNQYFGMHKSWLPRCTSLHGALGFKYKSPESAQQRAAMCQFPLTVFTSFQEKNESADKRIVG